MHKTHFYKLMVVTFLASILILASFFSLFAFRQFSHMSANRFQTPRFEQDNVYDLLDRQVDVSIDMVNSEDITLYPEDLHLNLIDLHV